MVYKSASPLNSRGEIQQAEHWPLTETITGIDGEHPEIADAFELKPNYPNPFNPETRISYVLPAIAGDRGVSLVIYNQIGQVVRTLVTESQSAGSHEVLWDGLDDQNRQVVSGIYFYRLKYSEYRQTRKMILLR